MKRFKDPIYGYIQIDEFVAEKIIDTAEFQRLRQIIQTSYSPLYASAVHNRFVHSLGVYHLGKIVTSVIEKPEQISELSFDLERYKIVFEYACLLHDVGHAPFSHTGEYFYLDDGSSRVSLHNEVIALTEDAALGSEIEKRNYKAAPHELMSVIVALKNYNNLFNSNEERSFFARCILGYNYSENIDINKSFLNCFISMLNSSIIDVDKLDYLIRDAYITGFDTVSIDYERLLHSIKIIIKDDNTCELLFSKSAVSVIENVVFAHDAERKWIQNHPVVQYEAFILKYAMEKLNIDYKIFDYESLSKSGKNVTDDFKVSLLCDGDILFLMKNYRNDELIDEYFARNKRRHPLWKSEAEYKAIFKPFSSENFEKLENEFEELAKILNYNNMSSAINDDAIKALEDDIAKFEVKCNEQNDVFMVKRLEKQIQQKNKHLAWLSVLKEFAKSQDIDFDFVIIKADQFNSGFGKMAFDDIKIYFNGLPVSAPKFKEITNALSSEKSVREKFFYIFYRKKSNAAIDVTTLVRDLGHLALDDYLFE